MNIFSQISTEGLSDKHHIFLFLLALAMISAGQKPLGLRAFWAERIAGKLYLTKTFSRMKEAQRHC